MVILRSGQQMDASITGSELMRRGGGGPAPIPKTEISRIVYVRFKPLPASYEWMAQESPILALFSPKTWQYALDINAMMSVPLYDSAMPEDDSPVICVEHH